MAYVRSACLGVVLLVICVGCGSTFGTRQQTNVWYEACQALDGYYVSMAETEKRAVLQQLTDFARETSDEGFSSIVEPAVAAERSGDREPLRRYFDANCSTEGPS